CVQYNEERREEYPTRTAFLPIDDRAGQVMTGHESALGDHADGAGAARGMGGGGATERRGARAGEEVALAGGPGAVPGAGDVPGRAARGGADRGGAGQGVGGQGAAGVGAGPTCPGVPGPGRTGGGVGSPRLPVVQRDRQDHADDPPETPLRCTEVGEEPAPN